MLAGDIIETLELFGGGHFTPAQKLSFLNNRQKFILGQNIGYMRREIVLTTVSGTLEYDLDTAYTAGTEYVRDVSRVFISPSQAFDAYFGRGVGRDLEIEGWTSTPGSFESGGATLTFDEDPGDGEVTLSIYLWPVKINQLTDPLTIPDQFEEYMRYDYMVYLTQLEYGTADQENTRMLQSEKSRWLSWNQRFEDTDTTSAWD